MRRGFWFVAGAASGVYALTKARRAAEALSPDGLRDRLAGLSLGAHLLGEEIRAEMAVRENDLRARLGLRLDETPELPASPSAPQLPGHTGHTDPTHELTREGIS